MNRRDVLKASALVALAPGAPALVNGPLPVATYRGIAFPETVNVAGGGFKITYSINCTIGPGYRKLIAKCKAETEAVT